MVSEREIRVLRLIPGDESLGTRAMTEVKRAEASINDLEDFLSSERNILMVATHDDRPVGFAIAYELDRADRQPPMLFLYEIEVKAEWHRRGVGRSIMEAIKKLYVTKQNSKMFVLTDSRNGPARKLYASSGGAEEYVDGVLVSFRPS